MRHLLTASFIVLLHLVRAAGPFTLHVWAPKEAGDAVLLYRYEDLLTLRTIRVAEAVLDKDGRATLSGHTEGTSRMQLRIGDAVADLFLRPGSVLHVEWPGPDPRVPRSLNRPAHVPIVFRDMDPLDINALTSDLNERLDDLLMEDLATDAVGGMQALEVIRKEGDAPDSTRRPPTLFITPDLSAARVDTFERKLKRFYQGIEDPWFDHYLEYGVAGLRHGPRSNGRDLYERYLKGRSLHYDDPEHMRFIRGFFEELLFTFALRYHEQDLLHALQHGGFGTLKDIMARHDFLAGEERLCELVTLDQLYLLHGHPPLRRKDAERLLAQAVESAAFPEHRAIAANMLWDITAMREGSELPAMRLQDLHGKDVDMETLREGPLLLVLTATWCTYCELEMAGLERLHREYKDLIPIVVVSLDPDPASVRTYLEQHPGRDLRWLHAVAERQLREDLRLRSLPTFFLVQDGKLVRSPAPMPSSGLGEVFHRTRVEAERAGRIKVWDD